MNLISLTASFCPAVRGPLCSASPTPDASGAAFGKGAPLSHFGDYPPLSERANPSAVTGVDPPDASLEGAFCRMPYGEIARWSPKW